MSGQIVDIAIVGAQKSGTTWLAESLSRHPEIYMARGKEAHFFDQIDVQEKGVSRKLFSEKFPKPGKNQKIMDATPSYIYLPGCLESLKKNNPKVRVIAVIRDPGQRAISHYYHSKLLGHEDRNLTLSLLLEKKRLKREADYALLPDSSWRNHSYVDRGRYFHQIQTLISLFPDALVIPFTLLVNKPQEVLNLTQDFLGVERKKLPPLPPMNANIGRRKHKLIASLIRFYTRSDTKATVHLLHWETTF